MPEPAPAATPTAARHAMDDGGEGKPVPASARTVRSCQRIHGLSCPARNARTPAAPRRGHEVIVDPLKIDSSAVASGRETVDDATPLADCAAVEVRGRTELGELVGDEPTAHGGHGG